MFTISVKSKQYTEARLNAAFKIGFERSGRMFKKKLVTGLTTGSRSGRTYLINGVRHVASAPGEMPAKRTGKLAESVDFHVDNRSFSFGDGEFYGEYLEDGTPKMESRPHVRIIGDTYGADGMRLIDEALRRAFT